MTGLTLSVIICNIKGGDKVLSIKEVAKELGFKPRTIKEWVRTGKIKAVKIIGEWRITEEEVERLKRGG